jgi:hypothetical protein
VAQFWQVYNYSVNAGQFQNLFAADHFTDSDNTEKLSITDTGPGLRQGHFFSCNLLFDLL